MNTNIIGGAGPNSGFISVASGGVSSLTVGTGKPSTQAMPNLTGNIEGGSGAGSGQIASQGTVGKLTLIGGLKGGSGDGSGLIQVNSAVNSLLIDQSITGGTGNNTGTISTFGMLKSATILGNIVGSSNTTSTILTNTGYLQAAGIGTLVLDGALQSGSFTGSGGLDTSGAIRSTASIKSITVGSLAGNATNPAIISAVGAANLAGTATTDVAIGTVKVTGSSTYGDILAGYSADTNGGTQPLGTGVNADAQIGTVDIVGSISATNIIAGVGAGPNGFGTAGSVALAGIGVSDLTTIISKISKIIIGSETNATSGTYGIAAQNIVSATVNGSVLALVTGPDNDTFAANKSPSIPSAPAAATRRHGAFDTPTA